MIRQLTAIVLSGVVFAATSLPADPEAQERLRSPTPQFAKSAFSAEFPYRSQYVEVLGSRMHYVDHSKGDVFLFLHGNPTSSYLWRNVMKYVAPHGRIVALDNIGFGKSDKPDLDYTFQTHYRYTKGFIDKLQLRNVTLVVHDWGSLLGLLYAVEHPENTAGVVLMEPLVAPTFPMEDFSAFGPAGGLFRRFRDPHDGRVAVMNENLFVEAIVGNATVTRRMKKEELDVYRAPFPTVESRYPIYRWPNELPIAGKPQRNVRIVERINEWLRTSDTPKLIQYASPGVFMSPKAAAWAANNYRHVETQFVGYGLHFIQEDNPESIGRGIVDWHRRRKSSGNKRSLSP